MKKLKGSIHIVDQPDMATCQRLIREASQSAPEDFSWFRRLELFHDPLARG